MTSRLPTTVEVTSLAVSHRAATSMRHAADLMRIDRQSCEQLLLVMATSNQSHRPELRFFRVVTRKLSNY